MKKEKVVVEEILEKPLLQATVADFWMAGLQLGVIETKKANELLSTEIYPNIPQFIIGVKALANFFNTSVSTISRWKSNGILDNAILQNGKIVIFDLHKVIDILRVSNQKEKGNSKWD